MAKADADLPAETPVPIQCFIATDLLWVNTATWFTIQ
jgi:hypothetical protein